MKNSALITACALALTMGVSAASPLMAAPTSYQDRDHDRYREDDAYRNNHHFQQGWKDGQHHKHKNHNFRNEDDRRAYEAGFAHGDRGDRWQDYKHDRH